MTEPEKRLGFSSWEDLQAFLESQGDKVSEDPEVASKLFNLRFWSEEGHEEPLRITVETVSESSEVKDWYDRDVEWPDDSEEENSQDEDSGTDY